MPVATFAAPDELRAAVAPETASRRTARMSRIGRMLRSLRVAASHAKFAVGLRSMRAMRLLVTGAAASSARISCATGSSATATIASSRTTCSRTRATVRTSTDVDDRITFVAGRHRRPRTGASVLREHEIEVVVNFAAESHNSLAVLDPGRFFRTNVLGTQRCSKPLARSGSSASTTSPHARCTATSRSTTANVHRAVAVPPAHAVQRVEGRRRPRRPLVLTRRSACR